MSSSRGEDGIKVDVDRSESPETMRSEEAAELEAAPAKRQRDDGKVSQSGSSIASNFTQLLCPCAKIEDVPIPWAIAQFDATI